MKPHTIPADALLANKVLPVGTPVKVNCYYGRIVDVTTHVPTIDPVTKAQVDVPLAHALYHIQINTSKVYPRVETANYIWIRKGKNLLRLFPDEFEVVSQPLFMDTQEDEFDMLFDDLDDEDSDEEEWDSVGTAPDPEIDVPLDAEQPAAKQPGFTPEQTP